MKISIVTLFPKMIAGFFEESIIKRAQEKKLVEIEFIDLRKFSIDSYGSVDDKPYGGGAGMVMRVDVITKTLDSVIARSETTKQSQNKEIATASSMPRNDIRVILTSAKGKVFNQKKAKELSNLDHLILIAGHYEGVDERVLDYVDEEISIGDFVLTGGELPVAIIADSIVRLIPGVLEKEEATKQESFINVSINRIIEVVGEEEILLDLKKRKVKVVTLLEYPHYTRPEEFQGKKVPKVLLSGNHKEIEKWRLIKAYEKTKKKRPDLLG